MEYKIDRTSYFIKKITSLIENGMLGEAKSVLQRLERSGAKVPDIFLMKAKLSVKENLLVQAQSILEEGIRLYPENSQLLLKLANVLERQHDYKQALHIYKELEQYLTQNEKENVHNLIHEINKKAEEHYQKRRITFFVRQGLDSFLDDIIIGLSNDYQTKKVIVTDLNQIEFEMQQADICWFEWCDELIIHASKLPIAKERKIICRLHRYETFTNFPTQVKWETVNKLLIVTQHLRFLLKERVPNIEKRVEIEVLHNGVDLERFVLTERKRGYNIAFVGYIHLRKNPVLLLQILKRLVQIDSNYKLFVAGTFQDPLVKFYWDHQIQEMGIKSHVFYEGWQENIDKWLKDKNYILSTSIHESFGYGIAEAMSRGVKPVIHNFPYADEIWKKDYLFNTIDEAVQMILDEQYDSKEYRKYIELNYSLPKQLRLIKGMLDSLENESTSVRQAKKKTQSIIKISYVIPVYNGEKFVRKAIKSILQQEVEPHEILIADDRSTDNSFTIVKEYEKKYKKIKALQNQKNIGEFENTNKLIEMATGDFIKILHQDDYLDKSYSSVIQAIDDIKRYPFIVNDFGHIYNGAITNNYLKKFWDDFNINPNELDKLTLQKVLIILGNYFGSPSNVLYNRELLLKIEYLESYSKNIGYGRDYFTYLKLMSLNKPLVIFKQLSYRNEHSNNQTSRHINSMRRVRGYYEILSEFEVLLNNDEKKIAYQNLFGRAMYSITNCNNKIVQKEMIDFVLQNYKFISKDQERNLTNMKKALN